MCIQYNLATSGSAFDAKFDVADNRLVDLSDPLEVCPDHLAPIIRRAGSVRIAEPMRWGFPPNPRSSTLSTNVWDPDSPYWRRWLLRRGYRCLIPASRFTILGGRTAGGKRPRTFAIAGGQICAFAGVWRPWLGVRGGVDGEHLLYTVVTCEPNELVGSVRGKSMPVVLATESDFDAWLNAPWDDARDRIRPISDDRLALLE